MVAQEKYVVRSTSSNKTVGYVCLGLFSLMTIGFTVIVLFSGDFTEDDAGFIVFGYLLLLCALFFSWLLIYREWRPRIVVKDNQLICYPRWRVKTVINIGDITSRKTRLKKDNDAMGFGGGLLGHAVTKGKYGYSLLDITYYVNTRPIININTNMKNSKKLDSLIVENIESKEILEEK